MATTAPRSRAAAPRPAATPDTAYEAPLPEDGRRRAVIESVRPAVDAGRFAAKAAEGDVVQVSAEVFADGHDVVQAVVQARPTAGAEPTRAAEWREFPLTPTGGGLDGWAGSFPVDQVGPWRFRVVAWVDRFETWKRDLAKRADAGQDLATELEVGARLGEDAAARTTTKADADRLRALVTTLRGSDREAATAAALGDELAVLARAVPDRSLATTSEPFPLWVDRRAAAFASWYERFPRSFVHASGFAGAEAAPADGRGRPGEHGTLRDLADDLPRIAAMGFDVLYLPPVHPIGTTHRKGRDNTPTAEPDDVGSPWGIGAAEGGHTAIHPDLGTDADFDALVVAAAGHGIELALDLAFQCSPDHPWVTEHPDWFRHRPDGSIRFAENPPKQYQDIYPIDFETDDWQGLWRGLKAVVDHWVARGVKTFRVDNPHTKAFGFWEWCIASVQHEHPDVVFLSEAFTRPAVMHRLAKLGFSQSYTYFTWRTTKHDLATYAAELSGADTGVEYFRPSFWTNTQDILPFHLQAGDRATYVTRMVLAATMVPLWGMFGPEFELRDHERLAEGREEYRHSEKYEVRHWTVGGPDSLEPLIARVNQVRREHPALQQLRNCTVVPTDNDQVFAFLKRDDAGTDAVLVVANLDPQWTQAAWVDVPLAELGLRPGEPYVVSDLLAGVDYRWDSERAFVQLDPAVLPVHVLHVRPAEASL